jgi:hypothetical protein
VSGFSLARALGSNKLPFPPQIPKEAFDGQILFEAARATNMLEAPADRGNQTLCHQHHE